MGLEPTTTRITIWADNPRQCSLSAEFVGIKVLLYNEKCGETHRLNSHNNGVV